MRVSKRKTRGQSQNEEPSDGGRVWRKGTGRGRVEEGQSQAVQVAGEVGQDKEQAVPWGLQKEAAGPAP